MYKQNNLSYLHIIVLLFITQFVNRDGENEELEKKMGEIGDDKEQEEEEEEEQLDKNMWAPEEEKQSVCHIVIIMYRHVHVCSN